jgi:hypothetical protein
MRFAAICIVRDDPEPAGADRGDEACFANPMPQAVCGLKEARKLRKKIKYREIHSSREASCAGEAY